MIKRLTRLGCCRSAERASRGAWGLWRAAGIKERRQCLGERLLHDYVIAIGCEHALEFRQLSLRGSQIEWRYIKNRVLDWYHKQVPTNNPRTHLVPQRQLLGDFRILIDQRFNLERTVDELIFGKLINNQLAVVG